MTGRAPDRLAEAVRALVARGGIRAAPPARDPRVPRPAPEDPASDASARLDAMEREVQEMRTRVNALFFAVITASVADLIARTVLQ